MRVGEGPSVLFLFFYLFSITSSSWMNPFGEKEVSKYIPKSRLKSLAWTSESAIEESRSIWWWLFLWPGSGGVHKGLFMQCLPIKPERACPLSLVSASCERGSEEEAWSCFGSHEEDRTDSGKKSSIDVQINYLGVDCPDEKDNLVNPHSCILRYNLFRKPSSNSSSSSSSDKSRGYLKESLLLSALLGVASLCLYFLRQNILRRRLGRRIRNLRQLLHASGEPRLNGKSKKYHNRSKSSSDLRALWGTGSEFELVEKNPSRETEDSLITFPSTPGGAFASELSMLNQERRLENVFPTRRRIRRSKSQTRLLK